MYGKAVNNNVQNRTHVQQFSFKRTVQHSELLLRTSVTKHNYTKLLYKCYIDLLNSNASTSRTHQTSPSILIGLAYLQHNSQRIRTVYLV